MGKKWLIKSLSNAILFILLTHPVWAGQVVTPDMRLWAREVLEQEQALEAVSKPNTLAVLYFENKTGRADWDPIRKGLALMLITDLSKVKHIQLLERNRLQALIEEIGLGVTGLIEPKSIPRVGKLLKAQWVVGGDITEVTPSILKLQSNFLDVRIEKVLDSAMAEGEFSELINMEKELLFAIIKVLRIQLTPEEEEELKRPLSTNIHALMALFKGIEESDKGEYEKSAALYKEALKLDKNLSIANRALIELKSLNLILKREKSRDLSRSLKDRTSLTNSLKPKYPTKRKKTLSGIDQRKSLGNLEADRDECWPECD